MAYKFNPFTGKLDDAGAPATPPARIVVSATQVAHGFTAGTPVRTVAGVWVRAQADSADRVADYVVTAVAGDTFEATKVGRVTTAAPHGLIVDDYYWLSQATAGLMTAAMPATGIRQSLLRVVSATELDVQVSQPFEGASAGAALTQAQVEDSASVVAGTVTGQRLSQAVAAFERGYKAEYADATARAAGTGYTVLQADIANGRLFLQASDKTLWRPLGTAGTHTWEQVGGGAADRVVENATQAAHGIPVMSAVRLSAGAWTRAQADADGKAAMGIVTAVTANTLEVTRFGRATVPAHGLTVDNYYWLSQATSGATTITQPTAGIAQSLLYVVDANTILVMIEQAATVGGAATTVAVQLLTAAPAAELPPSPAYILDSTVAPFTVIPAKTIGSWRFQNPSGSTSTNAVTLSGAAGRKYTYATGAQVAGPWIINSGLAEVVVSNPDGGGDYYVTVDRAASPVASATVTGAVELATLAEVQAGTGTPTTAGSPLVATVADLAATYARSGIAHPYANAAARTAGTGRAITADDIALARVFLQVDDGSLWVATGAPAAVVWARVGGGATLYTSDGTLISPRTVTMAGNSVLFDGAGDVLIEDSGQVTVAGLTLKENETLATGASPTITPVVNRVNTVTIANSVSGTITVANPTPSAAPMADYIKIGFVNSGAPAQTIALGDRYFGRDGTTALSTITVAFARVRQLEFQYRSDNWGGGTTPKWVLVSDTDGEAGTVVSDLARVRAEGGATITVTTSAQQVVFGTATTNVGNGYNATTGVFTAPTAGAYSIRARGYWNFPASAQAGTDFILSLRVNGVSVRQSNTENPSSIAYQPSAEVADTLTLAANDQVSVWVIAGSSITGTVTFVCNNTWGLFTVDQQPSGQIVDPGTVPVTPIAYGRVNASNNLAATAFSQNVPGTAVPFSNTIYSSGMTVSGTNGFVPEYSGRYRASWLMMAEGTELAADGWVHVVQGGTSVGQVRYNMLAAAGANQCAGFIDVELVAGAVVTLNFRTAAGAADTIIWDVGSYFQLDTRPLASVIAPGSIVVNDQTDLGYFDIGTKREQWGTATVAIDGNFTVNLPAPMANINYNIQLTHDDGWTSVDTAVVAPKWVSKGLSSFVIDRDDDVTGTVLIDWRVVGRKP